MNVARKTTALPFVIMSVTAVLRLLHGCVLMTVITLSLRVNAAELTPQQAVQANLLSTETPWPQARSIAASHPLGLQTLSVEKQERKNQFATRWVNVYQYHYTLKSARLLLIDLDTNTVIKQTAIDTVHLPLNAIEIEFAQSLLANDQDWVNRLRLQQTSRNKTAFSSFSELDVKASIYEPMNASHACRFQRCALVSLFDNTRTVFAIEPVVNLTTLEIKALDSQ